MITCCSTTQLTPPISCTSMRLAYPSSSGAGACSLVSAVAPVARQKRRMSNLEGMRSAIMPYFSIKCMAISPMAPPEATTWRQGRGTNYVMLVRKGEVTRCGGDDIMQAWLWCRMVSHGFFW